MWAVVPVFVYFWLRGMFGVFDIALMSCVRGGWCSWYGVSEIREFTKPRETALSISQTSQLTSVDRHLATALTLF